MLGETEPLLKISYWKQFSEVNRFSSYHTNNKEFAQVITLYIRHYIIRLSTLYKIYFI